MPIDIWFTRSDSVEGIILGAESENALPHQEFMQAMRESMARHGVLSAIRPDGTAWATHAAGSVRAGEPWYAARFVPTGQGRGHGVVSFSLTSRAMPEDVESFLEPALELGRALRCRVFEGWPECRSRPNRSSRGWPRGAHGGLGCAPRGRRFDRR